MNIKNYLKCILITIILILLSCTMKEPAMINETSNLIVKVVNESNEILVGAEVYWRSNYGLKGETQITDSTGVVIFRNLVPLEYIIHASSKIDENVMYLGSKVTSIKTNSKNYIDIVLYLNTAGLKINEVFFACSNNKNFYFYDQFIELYNGGADTVYLDSTIIIHSPLGYKLAGKDNDHDGDIDFYFYDASDGKEHKCFSLAFQLIGDEVDGKKYPILPGEYKVIACDAINHKDNEESSYDLSNANFEFFNTLCPRDPSNPDVPDYINLITGEYGHTTGNDFQLGFAQGVVYLANGKDSNYGDGIDIDTIIDGMVYNNDANDPYKCVESIDRGYCGYNANRAITKYSGLSIRRIKPGFDTNNSSNDFEIIDEPTPGYH